MTIFDFVKTSVSMLEVASSYVSLKRMGGYHKGPCPLHSEKDASFTVSPDKNIFYCFGCQAGGDVIAFIASVERLTQGQAVKHLIERYHIQVPEELQQQVHQQFETASAKESTHSILKAVTRWAHQKALNSKQVLEYWNNRGFSKKMIEQFEIGFIPGGASGINHFVKSMQAEKVLLDDLLSLGVVMEGKSSLYSPFEDRILFPIKDQVGRYVGFGGRVFFPHDERARYYNSKESDFFLKRATLFSFDKARKKAQHEQRMFLVEGYMDVVAMVEGGYENTVATLGTACTAEHLDQLRRFVHTIVLVYDGDKAGQSAVEKVAQLCWDIAITLKVVTLPPGEDPASLLQEGKDFTSYLEKQEDIFTFLIKKMSKDFFEKSMAEKVTLCTHIVQMINQVAYGIKRHLLLQQLSSALQIPVALLQKISKQEKQGPVKNESFSEAAGETKVKDSLEAKITSFFFSTSRDDPEYLKLYMLMQEYWRPSIRTLVDTWFQSSVSDLQHFLDSLREKDRQWILFIIMKYGPESVNAGTVESLILELKKRKWKTEVVQLRHSLHQARLAGDTKTIETLMNSFLILKQKMRG